MRKKIKKGFEKIEKKKDVEAYGEDAVVVVAKDGVVEGDIVEVVLLVGEAVVHHTDRRYHRGVVEGGAVGDELSGAPLWSCHEAKSRQSRRHEL